MANAVRASMSKKSGESHRDRLNTLNLDLDIPTSSIIQKGQEGGIKAVSPDKHSPGPPDKKRSDGSKPHLGIETPVNDTQLDIKRSIGGSPVSPVLEGVGTIREVGNETLNLSGNMQLSDTLPLQQLAQKQIPPPIRAKFHSMGPGKKGRGAQEIRKTRAVMMQLKVCKAVQQQAVMLQERQIDQSHEVYRLDK